MTQTLIDPRMFNTAQALGAHDGSALTGLAVDMVQLASSDMTGEPYVDFTDITSTYDTYMFVLSSVTRSGAANVTIRAQLSNNGGSSYHSSGYMHASQAGYVYSNPGSNHSYGGSYNDSTMVLTYQSVNQGTFSGNIIGYLHNPLDSSNFTYVQCLNTSIYDVTNDPFCSATSAGKYNTAEANDAIRFSLASGSFASGLFQMYGIK
ncbi:MAG: hypothetical protein VW443_02910 [Pseudomonadales bacterium]